MIDARIKMIKINKIGRVDFIKMSGGLAFLMLCGRWTFAESFQASGLVRTAQSRKDYTIALLKKLVTDIGPKPSGSNAYAKAAELVMAEMKRSLKDVNLNRYVFDNWEPINCSNLIVGGQQIEAVPQKRGFGTAKNGVQGIIAKNANGFAIVDESGNTILAYFSVNQYGKAIAGSGYNSLETSTPVFGIGKQDVLLLERSARHKYPAWIRSEYHPKHKANGINVIGRIPGKSNKEILLIAHLDTIFNTPGANDNTASVIVMLMLAHAASARENNYTLTFIASDSEEYDYEGARHYAAERIALNTMENIQYVFNFDSLTYGPNLWISSKDQAIKDLIQSIHIDLALDTKPIFDDSDGFVMDSLPFRSSNAVALHANSRGYDEKTLPVYHRPDDVAENVPLDCVESSFTVFDELLKRIDRI